MDLTNFEMNKGPKIIILGNQKSGTSAIAHLLAELIGLSKQIDLPRKLRKKGRALARGDMRFSELVRSHPEVFEKELVKIPSLTFAADQIREFY